MEKVKQWFLTLELKWKLLIAFLVIMTLAAIGA